MKILNTIYEDHHIHSINFSDGFNTIDEIVKYAGKIGMKKIVITDHSQEVLKDNNITFKNRRSSLKRWKNVHNDVDVSFGVEGDLLNEEWDCCFNIQDIDSDFCILSCHAWIYSWSLENITTAYINVINKYHDKIKFIGHICLESNSKYLDVDMIADVLNKYQISIEVNCSYLNKWRYDLEKLNKLIHLVEAGIYVNSDLHVLNDFNLMYLGFDYLKKQWIN